MNTKGCIKKEHNILMNKNSKKSKTKKIDYLYNYNILKKKIMMNLKSKFDTLPYELVNYIWELEGSRENNYKLCLNQMNEMFKKFVSICNVARATSSVGEYNAFQFLSNYVDHPHKYYLKKNREKIAFHFVFKDEA